MSTVRVSNTTFYYELHGAGQPLVLIAGYGGVAQSWMPIIKDLSKYFQVLIFDNHGIGQTIDDGSELSIELMAHDVMALCEALNLKLPHLVGRSMGGNIVQAAAAIYPDQISKIGILVSVAKWRRAALIGLETLIKMQEQKVNPEILSEASLAWLAGDQFLGDSHSVETFKQFNSNDTIPQTLTDMRRQFIALQHFNGITSLNKITAPTLIIYGAEDIIALPQESKFMADNISGSKLLELDCGHLIALEQPIRLVQELLNFLL